MATTHGHPYSLGHGEDKFHALGRLKDTGFRPFRAHKLGVADSQGSGPGLSHWAPLGRE